MRSLLLLALALPFTLSFGQTEFIINTTQDSVQRDPQMARDAAGNYAVVWKTEFQVDSASRGDIALQFFDASDTPIGAETIVNTVTAGDQDKPAIAMNGSGDLIVVWASHTGFSTIYDIKGRIFRNRLAVGDEFLVNTTTEHSQTNPDVDIDPSGNFVVVWDSWYQDGSDRGVYAQRFDAAGNKVGSEFRVNVTTAYSQARPAVRWLSDGRFVVVWESWKQDAASPSGYGVFARLFLSDGTPAGGEFQVNTATANSQWLSHAEDLGEHGFVIAWCSWEQDGDDGGIYLQRFSPAGEKTGGEVLVNRSTAQYQWLPRIRRLDGGAGFAVVWSSWKQDGDREGVYAQFFDTSGRKTGFEQLVNTTTESFQWEPDLIATGSDEILVVWSSWGQAGKNYEVVARRVKREGPQGYVRPESSIHTAGRSTSTLFFHVADTAALTGDSYEVGFQIPGTGDTTAFIVNLTRADTMISGFPLRGGIDVLQLTPVFEGIRTEFRPVTRLDLDLARSSFVNTSGTNLVMTPGLPGAGTKLIAPIDVALIWGNLDTLSNGTYANPLDTALAVNGVRNVVVPFRAWNLTDDARVNLLVIESTVNQRFDPGERIIFLTPVPYRQTGTNTHAQVATTLPSGTLIPPAPGDTNYILTKRPLTTEDRYRFSTVSANVVGVEQGALESPSEFALLQNYPNPFNPFTTIRFTLPAAGPARLQVINLLGQRVRTLVDEVRSAGHHRVLFDARSLSTGTYFYTLEFNGRFIAKKMLLAK